MQILKYWFLKNGIRQLSKQMAKSNMTNKLNSKFKILNYT